MQVRLETDEEIQLWMRAIIGTAPTIEISAEFGAEFADAVVLEFRKRRVLMKDALRHKDGSDA